MPMAMSQAKIIQEKAMIPVKEQPVSAIPESQETSADTFQIFEEVSALVQNRSFNRRCQKLVQIQQDMKQQQSDSVNPFCAGQSTIHYAQAQNCSIGDSESGLNNDIKNDLGRNLNTLSGSAKKVSMPKLILSEFKKDSKLDSSSSSDHQEKAVDSNKAIVVAYYARKLLIKALNALETYKEEQNAKEFLKQAVTQNYRRMLIRIHFC